MANVKSSLERINPHKFLLFSIIITAAIILYANFLDEETRILVSNLIYIPVPGSVFVLAVVISMRFRASGKHGKAWILFALFAGSWFFAEQIWMIYEVIYKIDPWPSIADFFYLAGYPLLLAFSILYLKPIEKAISKKLLVSAVIVSGLLLLPTLYIAFESASESHPFETALAASYPILDALIFCPAIIGLVLFFRGEVSFLWSLICTATILNVIADTSFLVLSIDDSYYTGHLIDLLYLWAYVLFAFGVYSHIKIFKNKINDPYEDIDSLK